ENASNPFGIPWQNVSRYHIIGGNRLMICDCGFLIASNEEDLGAPEPASSENGQHRPPQQEPLTEQEERCDDRKREDRAARQLLAHLQRKADTEQEENDAAPDQYDRRTPGANRQQAFSSVEASELHQRDRQCGQDRADAEESCDASNVTKGKPVIKAAGRHA